MQEHGMKRNTIKLLLRNRIEDWLESISDVQVKQLTKQDIIVTGGCIASMLISEKINDYDIYFKTLETTKAVADYYVNLFNISQKNLETSAIRSCNPEVRIMSKKNIRGEQEECVTIWMQSAGVAAEEQDGYHYFEGMPEHSADKFAESLHQDLKKDDKKKYRPVFFSQNAITLSDRVQIITRFYGNPEQIHKNFDYVHATCWYDYKEDTLVLPSEALEALLSKTLIYRGSLYPIASLFRIRKFIERGWRITAGQMLKIIWQVSELDLNNRELLNDQLIGVDQAYMFQLIQALRNTEGKVDATYIAKIIDGIFE